jgi:hypothetical protein
MSGDGRSERNSKPEWRAVKKIVESDGGDYETFVVGLCVARGSKSVWRFLAEN